MRLIGLGIIIVMMFSIPSWQEQGAKWALRDAEFCVEYNISNNKPYSHCF